MLTRLKESIEHRYRWLTRPFLKEDHPIVLNFVDNNFNVVKYSDYKKRFAVTKELAKLDFGGRTIVGMFWASVLGPIPGLTVWVRLFEHYNQIDQHSLEVVGYSMVWFFSDDKSPILYNSIYNSEKVFHYADFDVEFGKMAVNLRTMKAMRMSELGIFTARDEEKK